jgi:hypothetical protein
MDSLKLIVCLLIAGECCALALLLWLCSEVAKLKKGVEAKLTVKMCGRDLQGLARATDYRTSRSA